MPHSSAKAGKTGNIGGLLSPSNAPSRGRLLSIRGLRGHGAPMMRRFLILCAALSMSAGAAHAACYADYKAKRDNPLRLHYGVVEIDGACTAANAEAEVGPKLAADGWELLTIVGVFDDAGLDERRESAGDYYLRY